MSVTGGRSRWVRALASGGLSGALGVVALVSCGGRTSALDSDAYGANGDGATGGSASAGGRPSGVGATGGNAVSPTAGSAATPGGAPGLNPSLAVAPCNAYCPGYGTQCKERLMGQDCLTACQSEVNSFGERCQALGIEALRCLTPLFNANGGRCEAAVNFALTRCGKVANDFQRCKDAEGPKPPSMPMPTVPQTDVTSCPVTKYADAVTCIDDYSCSAGSYTVLCVFSGMTADCFCSSPLGSSPGTRLVNDGSACSRAAQTLCQ